MLQDQEFLLLSDVNMLHTSLKLPQSNFNQLICSLFMNNYTQFLDINQEPSKVYNRLWRFFIAQILT